MSRTRTEKELVERRDLGRFEDFRKVTAEVYEEIDKKRTSSVNTKREHNRYGIKFIFEDKLLPGGTHEFYQTVPVTRIKEEGLPGKNMYWKFIRRKQVFDSTYDMVVHFAYEASREAQEKLTEVQSTVETQQTETETIEEAFDTLEKQEEDLEIE